LLAGFSNKKVKTQIERKATMLLDVFGGFVSEYGQGGLNQEKTATKINP
jgi:hypothetical protein